MRALEILAWSSAVPTFGAAAYLLLLTVLSRRRPAARPVEPRVRFDVVVPAHDEELGIATTVASLRAMDYPRHLFRIVVVADNCTDATAARARAAGAEVMVRVDPVRRGKGHALRYAFRRLLTERRSDAIVVVDADSVVSPNLLRAFAARLERGAPAVQADYAVRNPDDSWRPLLLAVALGAFHRLRSIARERLRLSSGLRGNGMCFAVHVLRAVPYEAVSLAEDLEYGIRLGEAGHRVHHAAEATVFADMPRGVAASGTQHQRWEGGRSAMRRAHAARLIRLGVRDRVCLDLGIDLLVPPLAQLVVLILVGLVGTFALWCASGRVVGPWWMWLASALAVVAYVLRGWQLSGTGVQGLTCLARTPAYVAWKLLLRPSGGGAPREWVRTARERKGAT